MPPKRKTTNFKQSSISKRHKTSASSSSKSKKRDASSASAVKAAEVPLDAVAPRKSAFPADLPSKQSDKKDRKGKGPASIPIVVGHDLSEDESERGGYSDDAGQMSVDEDLRDVDEDSAGFLTRLDEKGMST